MGEVSNVAIFIAGAQSYRQGEIRDLAGIAPVFSAGCKLLHFSCRGPSFEPRNPGSIFAISMVFGAD
ncbi:MAG: hypothetical protein CVT49_10435 [candidate division Zixibacteria bacterium HGW-Zixibacteria-1]|nr:MAG: hypothetical protein CVT49_10435 [candidate division Zixibacteria bacterium HGW-Zixibacteria-1]